jgi:hypothetical protein
MSRSAIILGLARIGAESVLPRAGAMPPASQAGCRRFDPGLPLLATSYNGPVEDGDKSVDFGKEQTRGEI